MPKGNVAPHPLFDYLIAEKGMKNDSAISRKADILPSSISKVRAGHVTVSNDVRIAIMRAFCLSLAKVDELAPPVAKGEKK
jgi:hypothetical protein